MRYLLAILFAATASAQIVTYDSRYDARPDWRNPVDLADRKPANNPDFEPWMLLWTTPAMIDRETRIGVTITGTIAQAQADLAKAVSNTYPATVRERGRDVKADARQAAINAANANSVPALRAEVMRLAELIEQLQERIERIEQ